MCRSNCLDFDQFTSPIQKRFGILPLCGTRSIARDRKMRRQPTAQFIDRRLCGRCQRCQMFFGTGCQIGNFWVPDWCQISKWAKNDPQTIFLSNFRADLGRSSQTEKSITKSERLLFLQISSSKKNMLYALLRKKLAEKGQICVF